VQPHQCQLQGDYHFPTPAGHTIPDTCQDVLGLLGHLGALLAHIHLAAYPGDGGPEPLSHPYLSKQWVNQGGKLRHVF